MSEFDKIRESVATLAKFGIKIHSLHCSHEVYAALVDCGFIIPELKQIGSGISHEPFNSEEMGRGTGYRYEPTLCGILIEKRD